LLRTFGDQAAIAIASVRLFKQTEEALEQQTATAEVLRVISGSVEDAQPVFDQILDSCEALFGVDQLGIGIVRDGQVYAGAIRGRLMQAVAETLPAPIEKTAIGQPHGGDRVVHIPDAGAVASTLPPQLLDVYESAGNFSMVSALLRRDGDVAGNLGLFRFPPKPFTQKEIALLATFADQAVIAIQNAQLFRETHEALEQQTAAAEVLRTISQSVADTQPVYARIMDSCQALLGVDEIIISRVRDGELHVEAHRGQWVAQGVAAYQPMPVGETGAGRPIAEGRVVHIPDAAAALDELPPGWRPLWDNVGNFSCLDAPLLRDGRGIGLISVVRVPAKPFSSREIALLSTFADQAAIAIENARLFREIEEKSRQLEEASMHKSQFLASMSHELRTPLNAILGFNEMMIDGLCGDVPEGFVDPLNEVQTSGKHLLRLINNVLDLAKIEAGRMELVLADYSVQDLVESVRSTLRSLAAEKGLEFVVTVPQDLPLAHGDPGRLTQCLINLAGNSLKFTKQGKVEVSVSLRDDLLHFRVADTGIGIAPDKIESLFTEFKQTDATIASEYGGSGLGLSIVKKFVEMHGGHIWAESELGEGSTFSFEIPLRAQASAP
jgi:signal transduction histidine kinase